MAEESAQNMAVKLKPETLSALCCYFITQRLTDTIATAIGKDNLLELRECIGYLPSQICTDLMSTYTKEGFMLTDQVLHLFKDRMRAGISSIDLSGSRVTDRSLEWLAQHTIHGIDISGCYEFSYDAIQKYISKMAPTLHILILGKNYSELLEPSCTSSSSSNYSELLEPSSVGEVQEQLNTNESGKLNSNWLENESVEAPTSSTDNTLKGGEEPSTDMVRDLPKSLGLHAPNLHTLSVYDLLGYRLTGPNSPLASLTKLQHLDLTRCDLELENADCLHKLPLLSSLVLHETLHQCFDLNCYLPVLTKLTALRHLDISLINIQDDGNVYPSVNSQDVALQALLNALPVLYSLDISGTHLARIEKSSTEGSRVAIPGLAGRHFEFLGLHDCVENPCKRPDIPADRVTGTFNIAQVMEALKAYQKRPNVCGDIVASLRHMARNGLADAADCRGILTLVCEIMRANSDSYTYKQFYCSPMLTYLLGRPDASVFATAKLRRRIARVVYTGMDSHFRVNSTLKTNLDILYLLEVPDDLIFIFKDIATLLLLTIQRGYLCRDSYLQGIALDIINRMMRVDDKDMAVQYKKVVGDQGAIERLLWLIKSNLAISTNVDTVMTAAWGTLWNSTDETPENTERFVSGEGEKEGLELFYSCYMKYYVGESYSVATDSLLRKMIGLLLNVAEVDSVRPKLLKPAYLRVFRQLLRTNHRMEVSCHAAGIICHILADQPDTVWSGTDDGVEMDRVDTGIHYYFQTSADAGPQMETGSTLLPSLSPLISCAADAGTQMETGSSKKQVLCELVKALASWELGTKRLTSCRSFTHLLKLVRCRHTTEVRQWALWVVCNFTITRPAKYCKLLYDEDGIKLLQDMMSQEELTPAVLKLTVTILQNCREIYKDVEIADPGALSDVTGVAAIG